MILFEPTIGMVLQETYLFNATIRQNLSYARPEAAFDEVQAAARRARAHTFISQLPEGYDTVVGERGVKLSGGQKQRLSIARAFLHDPRILILDEPTSSVEPETEALIQASLEELSAVAHHTGRHPPHCPLAQSQADPISPAWPRGGGRRSRDAAPDISLVCCRLRLLGGCRAGRARPDLKATVREALAFS